MIREIGGAVDSCGESTLELTEEKVDSLMELIERKGTADMEELELEVALAEVYAKLDSSCLEASLDSEEYHWLECGWENPDVFSPYDHIEFGERELGYKFEYDESEFMDEDGEIDEDDLEDAKMEDFPDWLTNYKDSLEGEERRKFMKKFIDVDVPRVGYKVTIPKEILDMCVKGEENSSDEAGKITYYEPNNGYMVFEEGGKVGFFELNTDVKSPLFDDIDIIEMGEAIRVKKDGEWGFLAEDFTFLPEKEVEVNDDLSDLVYWFGWE